MTVRPTKTKVQYWGDRLLVFLFLIAFLWWGLLLVQELAR